MSGRAHRSGVDWQRRGLGLGLLAAASRLHANLPPPPAAPRPLQLPAPFEQRLDNGLRLVVAERRGAPLVSARLLLLSGSETDPPGHAGRAALTAALLGRGTARRGAPALAEAAESLGGSIVSESGRHRSSIDLTVTTPMLDAALALMAEVAMQPSLRAAELVRLRSQMLDELKLTLASAPPLAAMTTERLLFGSGAYGRAVDGTPTSLPRIRRGELVEMHAAHYRADNAVLLLVGDVDPWQALQLARERFGDWGAAAGRPPGNSIAMPPPLAAPMVAVDNDSGGPSAIALGLRLPGRRSLDESDAAALRVANAVLGAGYSSRLNQEIRIRRGLSYGAASSLNLMRNAGLLLATAQTADEHAAEVLELMHREIDRLIETPVGSDELAARKSSLIGRFARRIETTSGLADWLASQLAQGAEPASLVDHAGRIAVVEPADVQRQAVAHFTRFSRRASVVGDARRFTPALLRLEPRLVRLQPRAIDFD